MTRIPTTPAPSANRRAMNRSAGGSRLNTHSDDQGSPRQPLGTSNAVNLAQQNADLLALVASQRRQMQRMANHTLLSQVNRNGQYPIAQPSFPKTSNYRLPCPRKIFGLLYYAGDRGMVIRHIWNEMQSDTRGAIAALRYYEQLDKSEDEWKTLPAPRKIFLREEVVKALTKSRLCRDVLYVCGSTRRPKFLNHWPVEKMIMRVLNTERTANRIKDARMKSLEATLTSLREANEGRAAWIGKERVITLKAVGAEPGRPSLANDEEDEDDDPEENPELEDDDPELDFEDDLENQEIGAEEADMNA